MRFTEEELRNILNNKEYAVVGDSNPFAEEKNFIIVPKEVETKLATEKQPSSLESKFIAMWAKFGGNETYVRNYRFDLPNSRMELDFAWPSLKIAVEINGGQAFGKQSGHGNWAGLERDAHKQNRCVQSGWSLFWITTSMMSEEHLRPIVDFVQNAQEIQDAAG